MSTPIETNTEELQEVLESLYGLNMAPVGGGSSEPDLVIAPADGFTAWTTSGAKNITFDPEQVIATCDKVLAGKEVNVALTGPYILTTTDPLYAITYTATGVAANTFDKGSAGIWKYLVVQFMVMSSGGLSIPMENKRLEYWFSINTANRAVAIQYTYLLDQQ